MRAEPEERRSECDGGESEKSNCDDGCGAEDLVVRGVAGLVEEKVVLDAVDGDVGCHGDLDKAALVGSGEDVVGGEAEAKGGSGCSAEGELSWCLG